MFEKITTTLGEIGVLIVPPEETAGSRQPIRAVWQGPEKTPWARLVVDETEYIIRGMVHLSKRSTWSHGGPDEDPRLTVWPDGPQPDAGALAAIKAAVSDALSTKWPNNTLSQEIASLKTMEQRAARDLRRQRSERQATEDLEEQRRETP